MLELALHIAQIGLLACLTAWIFTGARDNWLFPDMNQRAIASVLGLDGLEDDYPKEHACIAHRRVTDPARVRRLYRTIVIWETLATVLLALATGAMLLSLLGMFDYDTARALGIIGALAFTLTWAGFTVGGNHYGYWYLHGPTQATHFLLALWGSVTMLLLAVPL